ncbi:TPA: hypothetical protein ENS27_15875, partial [bacterium]|nr:hypothetical protein [bacterium]
MKSTTPRLCEKNLVLTSSNSKDLVVVKGLKKYFPVRAGLFQRVVAQVQAVDNVSFTIKEGECL